MKQFFPFVAALSLLFSSCSQRLYFPDRVNTPGLTERYEAKATFAYKPQVRDDDFNGTPRGNSGSFSADLAFAPADHLGIIASYRGLNNRYINGENDDLDDYSYGGNFTGNRLEIGAGFWDKLGRLGRFELYAGYGNGSMRRRALETTSFVKNFDTRYHRFFLQPGLGVGNDVFSVMGGMRLAFQKYYDFNSPNPALRRHILRDSYGNYDVENEFVGFIEPYLNMEVGYRFVKFNMQTGFSAQYIGLNVGGELPAYITLGVTMSIAPRYLK